MIKTNLKNYFVIGTCSAVALFISVNFENICITITKIFEL